MNDPARFETLVAIMERLRAPGGCPWDREQDFETLRGYLLEECHEAAEALDRDDPAALCEELGDLLFQIVFLARLAEEQGRFAVADVVRGISGKMIRRHPHVFGSDYAETAEQVVEKWETIKRGEKTERASLLDGVPLSLPALARAQRLGARAALAGFDWPRPLDVLGKIEEELGELRRAVAAGQHESVREELGDVLFSLAMLARRSRVDPEAALARANLKFQRRFAWMESELAREGLRAREAGAQRLEQLWELAKRRERRDQST
jgi:MazG family protein